MSRTPATAADLTELMLSYLKARVTTPGAFTAHDVTAAFRAARPDLEIEHPAVKQTVHMAMAGELAQGNYRAQLRKDLPGRPIEYVPLNAARVGGS